MSTMPWGTMNGWLRIEGEQRGAWQARRIQDVRAAQVVRRTGPAAAPTPAPLLRSVPAEQPVDATARRVAPPEPCNQAA